MSNVFDATTNSPSIAAFLQQFAVDAANTTGLNISIIAGNAVINSQVQVLAGVTLVLNNNAINYIALNLLTGTIVNDGATVAPNHTAIYKVTTLNGAIVAVVDLRLVYYPVIGGYSVNTVMGDQYTLTGDASPYREGNWAIPDAAFTASITANIMTVTAVTTGTLAVGSYVIGGVNANRQIVSFGSGTGGIGTYNLSAGSDSVSGSLTSTTSGIVAFLNEYVMHWESHNVACTATGNHAGRNTAAECYFRAFVESGAYREFYAPTAAAGVVPTWVRTHTSSIGGTIVGNPGLEGAGLDINGVVYDAVFKVSDIGGTNIAQTVLHKHSTTIEPLIIAARSNSNTDTDVAVVNGMGLFSLYAAGIAGVNCKLFGALKFYADTSGTVSNTSAPGKVVIEVTPNGSIVPVAALSIDNSGAASFASTVAVSPATAATHAVPLSQAGSFGGFKNKIIGGDFTTNPWQRGVSFSAPATYSAYTADRFALNNSTDAAGVVYLQADSPTVVEAGVHSSSCYLFDVTTADAAIAAGQYAIIYQSIEGVNIAPLGFGQAGTRYITLSFWHKHTKTGIYCVALRNSAANRSYVAEYTQSISNTWEKAIITIPVDTAGTWLYDIGAGVIVIFAIACGSTFQTAANVWTAGNYFATVNQVNALDNVVNNFKLALIQLEAGAIATSFETRSAGHELTLCQRYYERIVNSGSNSLMMNYLGAGQSNHFPLGKVQKRSTVTGVLNSSTVINGTAAAIAITGAVFGISTTSAAAGLCFATAFDASFSAEL